MTYLEVVNKVLKRLREDPVAATNTNDYTALIGDVCGKAYIHV